MDELEDEEQSGDRLEDEEDEEYRLTLENDDEEEAEEEAPLEICESFSLRQREQTPGDCWCFGWRLHPVDESCFLARTVDCLFRERDMVILSFMKE